MTRLHLLNFFPLMFLRARDDESCFIFSFLTKQLTSIRIWTFSKKKNGIQERAAISANNQKDDRATFSCSSARNRAQSKFIRFYCARIRNTYKYNVRSEIVRLFHLRKCKKLNLFTRINFFLRYRTKCCTTYFMLFSLLCARDCALRERARDFLRVRGLRARDCAL